MFTNLDDIYGWLVQQTGDKLIHLKLLNLAHRSERVQQIVGVYLYLARLLRSQPDLIHALLRGEQGGWRSTLIGATVVILQRTSIFEDDLVNAIIGGTWVAPQVAAGFALTTQGKGTQRLSEFLDTASQPSASLLVYPKGILSAYAALKLLGDEKAQAFESNPHFETVKSIDPDFCIDRVFGHHAFWREVLSSLREDDDQNSAN